MNQIELCIWRGSPTGRADRSEDSFYVESGPREGEGPFCRDCFVEANQDSVSGVSMEGNGNVES